MKEEEKKEKEKETEEEKEHQAARITHRPMKRFTRACFEDSYRLRLDTSSTTYDEGRRVHRFPLSSLRRSEVERCSIDSCHEAASTPRVGKILSRISLSCSLFICRLQIELVMSADSAADISEGRLDEPKSNTYRAAPPPRTERGFVSNSSATYAWQLQNIHLAHIFRICLRRDTRKECDG